MKKIASIVFLFFFLVCLGACQSNDKNIEMEKEILQIMENSYSKENFYQENSFLDYRLMGLKIYRSLGFSDTVLDSVIEPLEESSTEIGSYTLQKSLCENLFNKSSSFMEEYKEVELPKSLIEKVYLAYSYDLYKIQREELENELLSISLENLNIEELSILGSYYTSHFVQNVWKNKINQIDSILNETENFTSQELAFYLIYKISTKGIQEEQQALVRSLLNYDEKDSQMKKDFPKILLALTLYYAIQKENKARYNPFGFDGTIEIITTNSYAQSKTYFIQYDENEVLYSVLNRNFNLKIQDSSYGVLLLGINDIITDFQKDYLAIYENSGYATKGIENLKIRNGTTYEVRYEKITF